MIRINEQTQKRNTKICKAHIMIKAVLAALVFTYVFISSSMGVKAYEGAGSVDASQINANDDIYLTGDLTLNMNDDLQVSYIYLQGYKLTITGDKKLTIDRLRSNHINHIYAPGGVITGSCLIINGADVVKDNNSNFNLDTLSISAGSISTNDSIYSNSINIGGGSVKARSFQVNNGVTISGGNVILTHTSTQVLFVSNGDLNITGGNISLSTTATSNAYVIGASGLITISGDNTVVDITSSGPNAMIAQNGINIQSLNMSGLNVGQENGYYYLLDSSGNKVKTITLRKQAVSAHVVKQSANKTESSSHTHSYSWVVTKYPTSTSDGEEAYQCSCGEIERTSILPAISAFEEETINKIKNAPANAVIEVETSLFNSFGIGVRDALAARPDVTLKVRFLSEGYRGQLLKVTIPTGIDRYALWDENGWLGLCRAGSTLGYDK